MGATKKQECESGRTWEGDRAYCCRHRMRQLCRESAGAATCDYEHGIICKLWQSVGAIRMCAAYRLDHLTARSYFTGDVSEEKAYLHTKYSSREM
jgi:hypothetical protein